VTDSQQYIVTRGGREMLRGDESELLNAARVGHVLSNDLIYDSSVAQWSFARSLTILRGFPLRDRTRTKEMSDADGSVIKMGRRQLNRRKTMGWLLRATGVFVFLILLTTTLFLIPDTKKRKDKQKLNNVLDLEQRAMKIEGSGSGMTDTENTRQGSSNMDSKRVVVDGEQDDTLETDQEGRKAALLLTPEEMAQLAQKGGDSAGTGKPGAPPATDDANPGNEQPSPSINAPALPPSFNSPQVDAEQPLVLIRPRLNDLKRTVQALSKEPEGKDKVKKVQKVAKQVEQLESDLSEGDGQDEGADQLRETIDRIRSGLQENCKTIESSDHCRLRIGHPSWSTVALNAVLRKDVVLGMSQAQVEMSIGPPKERRDSGNESVWCYDEACEKKVEYRKNRVLSFSEGIVTASADIETADDVDESGD
jgi:hypothetical protein